MQGIPLIMSGRDIIIHSETGSGKTLTYVLPLLKLLQQIPVSTPETGPVALIIAPTRELADQIHTTIAHFTLSPLVPEFMVRSRRDDDADLVRFLERSSSVPLYVGRPTASPRSRNMGRRQPSAAAHGAEQGHRHPREYARSSHRLAEQGMGVSLPVGIPSLPNRSVRYFVLDEADKACDIEMENQIRTVSSLLLSHVDRESASLPRNADGGTFSSPRGR